MSTEKYGKLLQDFRAGTELVKAIGARIRSERKAAGLTLVAAGEGLGISHSYLSDMEHGRAAPSFAVLSAVCAWNGCDLAWLLFGGPSDEERQASRVAQAAQVVLDAFNGGVDVAHAGLEQAVSDVMVAYGQQQARRMRMPVTARVSATPNAGIAWEPIDPPEWIEIPQDVELERVEGNSMRPVAWDGQIVCFASDPPAKGELGRIELRNGERYFKRCWVRSKDKAFVLESTNPAEPHEPMVVPFRKVKRARKWIGTLAL